MSIMPWAHTAPATFQVRFLGVTIMKILVSGATGLVGSHLLPALRAAGHEAGRLVRETGLPQPGDVRWNPAQGQIDLQSLESCDAVVNLSGDSIAAGRWTPQKKARILESRVSATRTLAEALAKLGGRSRTLINASAIGYYGNRGAERLDETSSTGSGDFLSEVCRDWEAATQPAAQAGVRVVLARFGVILSRDGGALKKMLLPFQLGLGGKIGSGEQYMSWIALDDVVGGIVHALRGKPDPLPADLVLARGNPSYERSRHNHAEPLAGPANFVAPEPVTNAEFTKTLGKVLGRPTIFPMPAFAARLAMGQMADELLLGSQRVSPVRLLQSGYSFRYPDLAGALRHVLDRAA